ncbi:MAG: PLP-dependent transferase [Planctomycetaceae bacterium]
MSGTEIRNLLEKPRWLAAELGAPMPDSVHAASACLPLWDHNIRYEEGDPQVVDRLRAAYPRFCLHPLVRQLCRRVFGVEGAGLIFPSVRCAERAAEHVRHRGGVVTELLPVPGTAAVGVRVLADDFGRLKEYWQHAGEIVSSRAAESLTAGAAAAATETEARRTVRRRFAEYGGCLEEEAWLFPSGMAAIACVWRAVRRLDPLRPTVQFGFPYVDTLKIQQRFSPQAWRFLPRGDAGDLEQLSRLLQSQSISALFCETPTNPLLTMPDLAALRRLADEHGFLLIVDDTLAAVINDNPLSWADAVATSLTKYFSGQGDVLAGGLRLNRLRPGFRQLQAAVQAEFEELLCDADAEVLERNSRDVSERVRVINRNAAELSERLSRHPAVQQVFYPAATESGVGRGGLMSIVLRSAAERTPAVFDRLRVCKGPNLGTSFTLCCPYTILAHYTELDEVEAVGVSRWLLRISVGTEPIEDLWERFSAALDGV